MFLLTNVIGGSEKPPRDEFLGEPNKKGHAGTAAPRGLLLAGVTGSDRPISRRCRPRLGRDYKSTA